MKTIYLFLCLLFLQPGLTAQTADKSAVVAATNMNILYLGIRNPIEIAVPGITSDKITATVTNGTIVKTDSGWEIRPASQTETVITVFADNKKISERIFRVKKLPVPFAVLAGKSAGIISRDKLLEAETLEVKMEDFVWNVYYEVKSFKVLTSKDGTDTEISVRGNKVTDEMKSLIASLKRGQNLIIKDIVAIGIDEKPINLPAIILAVN